MIDTRYNDMQWDKILYYDETSPTYLRWKVSPSTKIKKDSIAGCTTRRGYHIVQFRNKQYSVHRIIWWLHYRTISETLFIDHIDGNESNNAIYNLRLVPAAVNSRNRLHLATSKTRFVGVNLCYNSKQDYFYYLAHWSDVDGKINRKCFSINKFGKEEAFRLACEYRENGIKMLNSIGADYTDRHLLQRRGTAMPNESICIVKDKKDDLVNKSQDLIDLVEALS